MLVDDRVFNEENIILEKFIRRRCLNMNRASPVTIRCVIANADGVVHMNV